jgi:hypothetical protein
MGAARVILSVPCRDLVWRDPPFPFFSWTEAAIKRYLANKGFDLRKPIYTIRDMTGRRWEQPQ